MDQIPVQFDLDRSKKQFKKTFQVNPIKPWIMIKVSQKILTIIYHKCHRVEEWIMLKIK